MITKIKGVNKKMQHIVDTLQGHPYANLFLHPYVGDEEYDRIIKYKMDLLKLICILFRSTVQRKLTQQSYKSLDEFFFDLNTIWKNCQYYNKEDSTIYKNSMYFEKLTSSMKIQMEKDQDYLKTKKTKKSRMQEVDNRLKKKPCDGVQRVKLSHMLKTIKSEDSLIQTLNMIAEYCPEALTMEGDDVSICLNKLDANLCEQIERGLNQK